MDKFPSNEAEPNSEKVTEDRLVSLAQERPLRDPEVEEILMYDIEDDVIDVVAHK